MPQPEPCARVVRRLQGCRAHGEKRQESPRNTARFRCRGRELPCYLETSSTNHARQDVCSNSRMDRCLPIGARCRSCLDESRIHTGGLLHLDRFKRGHLGLGDHIRRSRYDSQPDRFSRHQHLRRHPLALLASEMGYSSSHSARSSGNMTGGNAPHALPMSDGIAASVPNRPRLATRLWAIWHALTRPGVRFYWVGESREIFAARSFRQLRSWFRHAGPRLDPDALASGMFGRLHWSHPIPGPGESASHYPMRTVRSYYLSAGGRIPCHVSLSTHRGRIQ